MMNASVLTSRVKNPPKFLLTLIPALFLVWYLLHPLCAGAAAEWTYYTNTGPVTCMAAGDGVFWCGTTFGLVRWNKADMSHEIIRVPDGLPHASIVDIEIAVDGTLWVATEKGGLASFDGDGWRVHSTENGLPSNNVLSLCLDSDGIVWTSTVVHGFYDYGRGISRWDGEEWRSWKFDDPDNSEDNRNFVFDIVDTPDGTLWTINGGEVAVFKDSTWTFSDEYPSFGGVPYHDSLLPRLHVDRHGALWLKYGGALSRYSDGAWTDAGLPDAFVGTALIVNSSGYVDDYLIGKTDGTVAVYTDGAFELRTSGVDEIGLTSLMMDADGTVWGGLSDGSLGVIREGHWARYELPHCPVAGRFHKVLTDKNGVVWAAGQAGIFRFRENEWETVVSAEGLPITFPSDSYNIFFDTRGTLWLFGGIYPDGNGLFHLDDNDEFTMLPLLPAEYSTDLIFNVLPGIDGDLWLSARYDGYRYRLYHYNIVSESLREISFPEEYLNSVGDEVVLFSVDPKGAVWVRTYTSMMEDIYRYDGGQWTHYPALKNPGYESGLSGMEYGRDGTVWSSVVIMSGSSHYPSYNSSLFAMRPEDTAFEKLLSGNFKYTLSEVDNTDRAWLTSSYFADSDFYGTHYNGIVRYDAGVTDHFTEFNSLPDNKINDVFADRYNTIWIATDKGICCYTDETTGVEKQEDGADALPAAVPILHAHPNPFNPSTMLSFSLDKPSTVSLAVYNVSGQKVRTLHHGPMTAGEHHVRWDGCNDAGKTAASGVYVARIACDGIQNAVKMTLMR